MSIPVAFKLRNAKYLEHDKLEQHGKSSSIYVKLNKSVPNSNFEVIVDIGVGSGNITETVTNSIGHNKIYGVDIDSNMIEFARQHSKSASIEYVLADLSQDWDRLEPKVSALEARVPLIVSNMCIDLINQKSVFVRNLKRLLRPSAGAYFTFPIFPDITRKLSADERALYEQYVKLPDQSGQLKVWTDLFEDNDFEIVHKEVESAVWTLHSQNLLGMGRSRVAVKRCP